MVVFSDVSALAVGWQEDEPDSFGAARDFHRPLRRPSLHRPEHSTGRHHLGLSATASGCSQASRAADLELLPPRPVDLELPTAIMHHSVDDVDGARWPRRSRLEGGSD